MVRFGVDRVLALEVGREPDLAVPLRQAELNLAECLRLFAEQPGVQFSEDERGVRFLSRNSPPDSMILRARSALAVEELIESELEPFGAPVDVVVFPSQGAVDLSDRLRQRGLVAGSSLWMIADLDTLPTGTAPTLARDFRVEVVDSTMSEAMTEWVRASAAGFAYDELSTRRYHSAYTAEPAASSRDALRVHHLGYAGDHAVCSSTLLFAAGIAGIYDVSTVPGQRRKGYAARLLRAVLAEAKARGSAHACLMSSPLGQSVYRAAGFGFEFDVPEYRWSPAQRRG